MPSENYAAIAKQYAEAVVAGEILSCRWVQMACKRQLNDLAKFKGKSSPYRFNPKLKDKEGRSFAHADNLCGFSTNPYSKIRFDHVGKSVLLSKNSYRCLALTNCTPPFLIILII